MNEFTRAEGRHAVSNLVAPLLLAAGLVQCGWAAGNLWREHYADPPRKALLQLLMALGLAQRPVCASDGKLAGVSSTGHSPFTDHAVQNDVFERFSEPVRFLLVDDQARSFEPILRCVLAGDEAHSSRFNLRSVGEPQELVDSLYATTGVQRPADAEACERCGGRGMRHEVLWDTPRVIGGAEAGAEDFDVVVLDLRLFPERDPTTLERTHLQQLLDFYHSSGLCNDETCDGALRGAADAARKRLEQLMQVLPDEERPSLLYRHHQLLPLLIAQVDPSLSVVLFSSTTHAGLREPLKCHPSIITEFSKPVVTGYDESITAATYVERLTEALRLALWRHEERVVWLALARRAREPDAEIMFPIPNEPFDGKKQREVRYTVDANGLRELAGEYCNTILHGRFADALMVPANWLDAKDASPGSLNKFDGHERAFIVGRLCALINEQIGGRGNPFESSEDVKRVVEMLWHCGDNWCSVYIEPFLRLHQKRLVGEAETRKYGQAVNYILNQKRTRERHLSSKDDLPHLERLGLRPGLAGWAVMAGFLYQLRDIIGSAQSNDWRTFLEKDAAAAIFSVLKGLRHARAHYRVRSTHNAEVREIALWGWLWFLATATGYERIVEPGDNPDQKALLGTFRRSEQMKSSESGADTWEEKLDVFRPLVSSKPSGEGAYACRSVLARLLHAVEKRWFIISDEHLDRALVKILAGYNSAVDTPQWLGAWPTERVPEYLTVESALSAAAHGIATKETTSGEGATPARAEGSTSENKHTKPHSKIGPDPYRHKHASASRQKRRWDGPPDVGVRAKGNVQSKRGQGISSGPQKSKPVGPSWTLDALNHLQEAEIVSINGSGKIVVRTHGPAQRQGELTGPSTRIQALRVGDKVTVKPKTIFPLLTFVLFDS